MPVLTAATTGQGLGAVCPAHGAGGPVDRRLQGQAGLLLHPNFMEELLYPDVWESLSQGQGGGKGPEAQKPRARLAVGSLRRERGRGFQIWEARCGPAGGASACSSRPAGALALGLHRWWARR